jgi:DNA-binding transcriptional LysR family regulator
MESPVELKELDLNLLTVFNQLLIERRVSRVAETLDVSQPAVSNALARLRRLLGDPLFLPTPRGMQPTPFAELMAEPVATALGMIHSAVNQRSSFEPATSRRAFRIAMTDIGEIYFLPKLLRQFQRSAPDVSVTTVRNTAVNLKEEMEAGSVDLAVGYLPALRAGFFQRRLFRHRYVCLFRKGHPLGKRKISVAEFSRADHVVVVSAGTGHNKVDEVLERSGITRKVRLTVPHFVAVGYILRDTDMVATVPERFAERVAGPFGLAYVPHPVKLPEIAINLFWHAKSHRDPANQWLRESMFQMYADAGPAV